VCWLVISTLLALGCLISAASNTFVGGSPAREACEEIKDATCDLREQCTEVTREDCAATFESSRGHDQLLNEFAGLMHVDLPAEPRASTPQIPSGGVSS